MKSIALKAFVLAVGIVAIIIINGCEEQQTSGGKMARIIAAENIQLKKQLQQYKSEIEKLKKQYDIELKTQEELLAKCRQEKKSLEEQLAGKYEDQINDFFKNVAEESGRLDEENKQLKAQVEELEAELEKQKTQDEQTAEPL